MVGLALGCIATYFALQSGRKALEAQLLLAKQREEQCNARERDAAAELQKANGQVQELSGQLTQAKVELGRACAELQAEREHNSKEAQLRQEQFEQQLKTVQEQFGNLATKVLDSTSDKLKTTNTEAMEHITRPLNEKMQQLQAAIDHTNKETAQSKASLSEQIKAMSEQTARMESSASMLTNVIKGGNKAQGNWGERMLTEILEAQGYKLGVDFDVQHTITDEKGNAVTNDDSGRRMIPDVILHYPNNEDVVVDSKMSIEAYYEYVNTDDEAAKSRAADNLVKSIRTQAVGLAKKDYSRYIKSPRRAIDFVIMFVPNEGALQLALAHEPRLWGEAFDRHVFITGQQNLMAILRMIQIAWRQYAQTESQKKVFDLAEEMMKRVGEFIKRFNKLEGDINTLYKDYEEAHKKAYSGKQSIVQKANELKQLGVKVSANHPIPETDTDLLNDYEEKE